MSAAGETSFPKQKIRIVLAEKVHPRADEVLTGAGFGVERVEGSIGEEQLRHLVGTETGAHVVGIRSRSQIGEWAFAERRRLLAVGCFCIGTNQVDIVGARRAGVPVFNSPFSNTRSVAELTISEIIALHRRVVETSMAMHSGVWRKSSTGSHEVRGRTLGIIGYGRIGSQVSVLAEAMGMRVIYFDVAPVLPMGNAQARGTLEEVLKEADVVSLHVPATGRTERMIGANELSTMKPGAHLINNARGSVVDLGALASALKSGAIGGAALDVFPDEPSSNEGVFASEVCGLSNVILTPHVGGSTEEAQRAIAEDVAGKILRFINEGTTVGAVNVPEVDLPSQDEGDRRSHRILHFHQNVPGVMAKIHGVIGKVGANVSGEYLRTLEDIGYVVLDVDPTDAGAIAEGLRGIEETVRVRVLY